MIVRLYLTIILLNHTSSYHFLILSYHSMIKDYYTQRKCPTMNQAELIGRLTADPELKMTKKDNHVVHFFLAINRHYGKAKNSNEQQADFIPCVAWNGAAKCLAEHCVKGSRIGVRGPIRSRIWETQDGQRKYVMEIRVDEFEFLEHPRKKNATQNKENKDDKDNKGDKEKTDEMVEKMTEPSSQSTMDSSSDAGHVVLEPESEEEDPWFPPVPPVF